MGPAPCTVLFHYCSFILVFASPLLVDEVDSILIGGSRTLLFTLFFTLFLCIPFCAPTARGRGGLHPGCWVLRHAWVPFALRPTGALWCHRVVVSLSHASAPCSALLLCMGVSLVFILVLTPPLLVGAVDSIPIGVRARRCSHAPALKCLVPTTCQLSGAAQAASPRQHAS